MAGMNKEWALGVLDEFISGCVTDFNSRTGEYQTRSSEDELIGQAQVVEQILDRVVPGWPRGEWTSVFPWSGHRKAALRAREELIRSEELSANLGEDAPELSAADLHPWIWDGARSLWQSGHYREAVEAAIKKLNAETQNKVGRRDLSETKLFKESFSMTAPTSDAARLRRMPDDGSDTYKSAQRGAMILAEGVFAGIRNPLAHEDDQELTEQEALEYLATLSVLARWVDHSSVQR